MQECMNFCYSKMKVIRSMINASYVTLAVRETSHNDTRETQ